MNDFRDKIIRKYRHMAALPDFLFGFTFPFRRMAAQHLQLPKGGRVLEVGCSSGANFRFLEEAVGAGGEIVGVDLSPDMIHHARRRVERMGWQNIHLLEGLVEDVDLQGSFDGLLLFAVHDVMTSAKALDNALSFLKTGGTVVTVGPVLTDRFPGALLNPIVHAGYKHLAISQQDKDRPWRLLSERVPNLQIKRYGPGIMYVGWGSVLPQG
jgi:demethylmenaquinone methyltransferase/2-methoxy-6-polyprenyl-1,4-benzoquinol methylase